MALQLPPYRAYAGNPDELVVQVIQVTLSMSAPKFVIIGHQNAITYLEIFPLIRSNRLWLGHGFNRNCAHFINKHYIDYASDADHKEGHIRVSGVQWFTNLDLSKRHEEIPLFKNYNDTEYPSFDNYNAINVGVTSNIPCDFEGAMGVPITFLNKYNPDQFDIVSCNDYRLRATVPYKAHGLIKDKDSAIGGKPTYVRILIRKKLV